MDRSCSVASRLALTRLLVHFMLPCCRPGGALRGGGGGASQLGSPAQISIFNFVTLADFRDQDFGLDSSPAFPGPRILHSAPMGSGGCNPSLRCWWIVTRARHWRSGRGVSGAGGDCLPVVGLLWPLTAPGVASQGSARPVPRRGASGATCHGQGRRRGGGGLQRQIAGRQRA